MKFIAGTRGSALALWQTRHVASLLTGLEVEERVITTQGDVNQSARLVGKLEKGFFTQELEAALHTGEIDWAVHSLKDLPTRLPEELALGAVLARAPAADLLLVRPDAVDPARPLSLRAGATVGSSSLRREALLTHFDPGVRALPLRGNVPTRITKLGEGQYDAIVLAEAGVTRLGLDLSAFAAFRLNPRRWPGAPGQGAIAVQCRADDARVLAALRPLHHLPTAQAVGVERDFLRILEGGCTTPFGCFIEGGLATLGLATSGGWRSLTLPLAPSLDRAALQAILDDLDTAPLETSHDQLTQRL